MLSRCILQRCKVLDERKLSLGKGPSTKSDEFLEKIQTAATPPLIFGNYSAIFYDSFGCIYARSYDGCIL